LSPSLACSKKRGKIITKASLNIAINIKRLRFQLKKV